MPPANSPWGKKAQQKKPLNTFPSLKNNDIANDSPKSPYQETQDDELIALASIYGDDFRRIETHQSAWKVCKIRSQVMHDVNLILYRNRNHHLRYLSKLLMRISR